MYNDYEFYKFPSEWATIGRSENIQVEYVSQSIDALICDQKNELSELDKSKRKECIMNNQLEQRKLQLEQELEEVNRQLVNQSKLEGTLEIIRAKLKDIQKIFPELNLEIYHNLYDNTLSIKEYTLTNTLRYYKHKIDFDNIGKSLLVFDDILNNPDKYITRHKIITKLINELKIEDAYLVSGSIIYVNDEAIPVTQDYSVYRQIEVRGTFTHENNLNIKARITYEQIDDFSDEYDIELDGFTFNVQTQINELESLDFINEYRCKLESISPEELLSIIEKLKETTHNHSIIVNLKEVVRYRND